MTEPIPLWSGGVTTTGKLRLDDRPGLDAWLNTLAGQRVELTIRPARTERSLQANKYYWGVIVPLLGEYCGYDKDDMHAALKLKFLTGPDGKPKSTSNLSKAQFAEFVTQCQQFGAELGVVIPDPAQVSL
jgi:hypothetical protein